MSESNPKEIGRLAGRIFGAVVPKNWALRSQEDQEDYGVDYEVELITPEDKPTGFLFKIQQKGVEEATRLADGSISYGELSTEKMTYYLRQLRVPLVLVVVDLATTKCYWIPLHGNREVEAALDAALAANQKKMTVHIPAGNVLPETTDALLASVNRMMDALTLEGLKAMPSADAQALIDSEPNIDELEKGLRFTQSLLRSTRTKRLVEKGAYEEAFKLNEKAFADDGEPTEVRFASGMELVRIGGGMTAPLGERGREDLIKLRLQIHHQLVRICRPLPSSHQLRFFSLFLARTSRLRERVHADVGLFFSRLAQQSAPDEFVQYVTAGAQRKSTLAVTTELHHAQRLLLELASHGWIGLVVHAWADLTEAVMPFLTRLEKDDLGGGANSIREWLHNIGTLCREVVIQLKDDDLIGLCAVNHARIDIDTTTFPQRLAESRELLPRIVGEDERNVAASQLDRLAKLVDDKNTEQSDEHDQEGLEEIVRQMAHGLGINIDDPNDRIADVVRVGLQDANPERALRSCKHLVVQLGSVGVPAQMLGLPTAGFKDMACRKHGYRSSAFRLDDLAAFFQRTHCDGCPDREPHPADWKWTRSWQRDQELGWEQDQIVLRDRPARTQPSTPPTPPTPAALAPRAARTPNNAKTRADANEKAKRKAEKAARKRNKKR